MSLLGTVGAAVGVAQGVQGLFGGGGNSANPNVARSFSRRCNISPAVSQQVANVAKRSADPCATARSLMLPQGVQAGAQPINVFERALGGLATAVSGTAQASPLGAAVGVAGAVLSPALRRKAVAFAKSFGIQLAATIFGISLIDMASLVANPPKRRRRGITAAQLANARRVNCKIQTMAKTLGMTCSGRAAPRRRKTTCR